LRCSVRAQVRLLTSSRRRLVGYTAAMTMLDLGPERPGQASETRQMSDLDRMTPAANVSGRVFGIGLAAVVVVIALLILLLR
jgi:hypothetical protein